MPIKKEKKISVKKKSTVRKTVPRTRKPTRLELIRSLKEECRKIIGELHELSLISPKPVEDATNIPRDIEEMEKALGHLIKKDEELHILQEKFSEALHRLKGDVDHPKTQSLNLTKFIETIASAKRSALHLKEIFEDRLLLRRQFNEIESRLHELKVSKHGFRDTKHVHETLGDASARVDRIKKEKLGLGRFLYAEEIDNLLNDIERLKYILERYDSGFRNIEWRHEPDDVAAYILERLHMSLPYHGIPKLDHEDLWAELTELIDPDRSGWRVCTYISNNRRK